MSATVWVRNGQVPPWLQERTSSVQGFLRPTPIFFRGIPLRRPVPARGAPHRLADDPDDGALPQAAARWTQAVWLPRLMRARWQYWAPVRPDRPIGQIS